MGGRAVDDEGSDTVRSMHWGVRGREQMSGPDNGEVVDTGGRDRGWDGDEVDGAGAGGEGV